MSGIAGIWNMDGRPVEPVVLAGMSSMLAHRGPDGEDRWIDGSVGLAHQHLRVTLESLHETQPLVHASGTVVVFDGRLDNREELVDAMRGRASIALSASDPELVLLAYDLFGEAFAHHLNGDFAIAIFDAAQSRLLLIRDAIGARPLYYHRTNTTMLFASEIKALLVHPEVQKRPNDDMLAEFLLGDGAQRCHGMTFFDGVSSLIPGEMAIVTRRDFHTRRYWEFDSKRRIRLGCFEEYVEMFGEHFKRAVRRRLRSAYPVIVSVSGGVDSSSILCLAESLKSDSDGLPPVCGVSYVSPDGRPSDEKTFLLDIERAYGIKIERIPYGPLQLLDGSREELRRIEAPLLRTPRNPPELFQDAARQLGARVLLTGHWGDQMLASQDYLVDLFRKLKWRTVWAQLNEYARWYTDSDPRVVRRNFVDQLLRHHIPEMLYPFLRGVRARLFRTRPTGALYSAALVRRAQSFAFKRPPVRGAFATAYARSIYQMARSWYYVQWMEWNNKTASMSRLDMAYPFLDRDLIAFVLAIPGEVHTWKGVPKALLRAYMKGGLPETIRQRRWKADTTDFVNEAVEREFPLLIDCLESGKMALEYGYVREHGKRRELTRLRGALQNHAECEVAWSVGDLLGLELWLQVFFGEGPNGKEALAAANRS